MKPRTLTVLGALFGIQLLMAYWTAGHEGHEIFVTNGTVRIPMGSDKIAQQTAQQLNNEEDKAEKRKEKQDKKDDKKK